MNHLGWNNGLPRSFPPSHSIFWDSFPVFRNAQGSVVSFSGLTVTPSRQYSQASGTSPSEQGSSSQTPPRSQILAAVCSGLASFIDVCRVAHLAGGFFKQNKQKKGIPQFPFPPGELPWLFSSQAAAHSPLLLSHTGALHLRNNRGTLRHRPT